jgi:hypothetical protein
MARKNDKAGKGKLVTISFRRINRGILKVSSPGHHSRTGASVGPNRVRAHSNQHKH